MLITRYNVMTARINVHNTHYSTPNSEITVSYKQMFESDFKTNIIVLHKMIKPYGVFYRKKFELLVAVTIGVPHTEM